MMQLIILQTYMAYFSFNEPTAQQHTNTYTFAIALPYVSVCKTILHQLELHTCPGLGPFYPTICKL